jgi:hypothetical protein
MYDESSIVPGTVEEKNLRRVTSAAERNIMGKSRNMAQKAMPLVNFCTSDLNCTTVKLSVEVKAAEKLAR